MALEGTAEMTEGSDLVAKLVARLAEQNELLASRDADLAKQGALLASRDADLAKQSALLASRDADLAKQSEELAALSSERDRLWRAYERLKEELLLVKRRLFIAKAERVDTTQLELEFEELSKRLNALASDVPNEDESEDEQAPKRKRKGRPKGRRNLAEADLPEVTIEVADELFERLVAEGKAERIGTETSYKLGYQRGGYRKIALQRIKYRALDGRGESTLETAPLPPELLRRSLAAPSTLAHLATQKFCDGLPLYRLEDICARDGLRLDRGTMSRWLEDLGASFGATVVAAMDADALANAFCIATDATGFAVQPGARDGPRRPCRKGHYFVKIADRDHILFEYHAKHTSKVVRAMFKGFEGYLQADAASVYDALFRPSDDEEGDGKEGRGRTMPPIVLTGGGRVLGEGHGDTGGAGERGDDAVLPLHFAVRAAGVSVRGGPVLGQELRASAGVAGGAAAALGGGVRDRRVRVRGDVEPHARGVAAVAGAGGGVERGGRGGAVHEALPRREERAGAARDVAACGAGAGVARAAV